MKQRTAAWNQLRRNFPAMRDEQIHIGDQPYKDTLGCSADEPVVVPFGGARLLTSRPARTLAPPLMAKCTTTDQPISLKGCMKRTVCVFMRFNTTMMLSIPKYLLVLAHLTVALNMGVAETRGQATFFRSDAGVASANTGPLPDQFDAPTKLRWRTRVDSGQSTP